MEGCRPRRGFALDYVFPPYSDQVFIWRDDGREKVPLMLLGGSWTSVHWRMIAHLDAGLWNVRVPSMPSAIYYMFEFHWYTSYSFQGFFFLVETGQYWTYMPVVMHQFGYCRSERIHVNWRNLVMCAVSGCPASSNKKWCKDSLEHRIGAWRSRNDGMNDWWTNGLTDRQMG